MRAAEPILDAAAPGIWRYRAQLGLPAGTESVSLGEGGTPLHVSRGGGESLLLKDETRNPTGSHKDRALAVALAHARAIGAHRSVVVSSGSTGVSHAAYAARAGIASTVLVPRGTPAGRLIPLLALGSTVLTVDSTVDGAIAATERLAAEHDLYLSSTCRSSNPHQAEGPRTIAYEIAEQLGDAPDWMVVPVGGGGTIAAIWRGFCELRAFGRVSRCPCLLACVPATHDVLARAARSPERAAELLAEADARSGSEPATVQVKTAHMRPLDAEEALAAIGESNGTVLAVEDDAALDAQRRFGAAEGIYIEPSSAAAWDAYERARRAGTIAAADRTVMLVTGSGFRETFSVADRDWPEPRPVSLDELVDALFHGARDGTS